MNFSYWGRTGCAKAWEHVCSIQKSVRRIAKQHFFFLFCGRVLNTSVRRTTYNNFSFSVLIFFFFLFDVCSIQSVKKAVNFFFPFFLPFSFPFSFPLPLPSPFFSSSLLFSHFYLFIHFFPLLFFYNRMSLIARGQNEFKNTLVRICGRYVSLFCRVLWQSPVLQENGGSMPICARIINK